MREVVTEDEPRYGRGLVRTVVAEIDSNTEMEVSLPRNYTSSVTGEPARIPYAIDLGRVTVQGERAEIERLHALLGHALAVPDPTAGTADPR